MVMAKRELSIELVRKRGGGLNVVALSQPTEDIIWDGEVCDFAVAAQSVCSSGGQAAWRSDGGGSGYAGWSGRGGAAQARRLDG